MVSLSREGAARFNMGVLVGSFCYVAETLKQTARSYLHILGIFSYRGTTADAVNCGPKRGMREIFPDCISSFHRFSTNGWFV
jgi:hypothetical protein